jgi:hypothetical protein
MHPACYFSTGGRGRRLLQIIHLLFLNGYVFRSSWITCLGEKDRLQIRDTAHVLGMLIEFGIECNDSTVRVFQLAVEVRELLLLLFELRERLQELLVLALDLVEWISRTAVRQLRGERLDTGRIHVRRVRRQKSAAFYLRPC